MKEVFRKNKKGVSDIIITLIIILVSMTAIIVVWVVVSNLINSNTDTVGTTSKCLGVDLEVTKANCSNGETNKICDITIKRTGTESSEIGGAKLVFRNTNTGDSSELITLSGNIEALVGKKATGLNTGIANDIGPNQIELTVFFTDDLGNEELCQQTFTYDIYS